MSVVLHRLAVLPTQAFALVGFCFAGIGLVIHRHRTRKNVIR